MKEADIKFNLIKTMILNYQMNRQYRIKKQQEQLAEQEQKNKKAEAEENGKTPKKGAFSPKQSDDGAKANDNTGEKKKNFKH